MTDEQFCKIESAISGEKVYNIDQINMYVFTGRELKEYLEEALKEIADKHYCRKCKEIIFAL